MFCVAGEIEGDIWSGIVLDQTRFMVMLNRVWQFDGKQEHSCVDFSSINICDHASNPCLSLISFSPKISLVGR